MAYLDKDGIIQGANRETDKSIKELEGWSARIMMAILAPLKDIEIERYPIGKGIPDNLGNNKVNLWGKL